MDLIDKIKELMLIIPKQIKHIKTEEATKNAFVMPFIRSLGYDIFNPIEVIPEFTVDIGIKKGEKVDYAIKKDDKVIILIECKWAQVDLDQGHASQLYRYFSVTDARFGILTNGIEYRFYSDIDETNKMDSKPFFIFNILEFQDHQIKELKKFTKPSFSLDDILTTASTLKYTGAIKKILEKELSNPSEAFVRFFASQIFDGRLTKPVLEQFTKIVQNARQQFIKEKINERLKSALSANEQTKENAETEEMVKPIDNKNDIVTTEEEIEGYNIVRAIAREIVDIKRVTMRDTKSYCGILLDDNNRKPICRLRFDSSQKYIGILWKKKEEKIPIDSVDDIFKYAQRIKSTIMNYDDSVNNLDRSKAVSKMDERRFKEKLDQYGLKVFSRIFDFGKKNDLLFKWGSKGFSLNFKLEDDFLCLFYAYPPDSVYKQSIYTDFEKISKKFHNSEEIIELYRSELEETGMFIKAKSMLKWCIDRAFTDEETDRFLNILAQLISGIKKKI